MLRDRTIWLIIGLLIGSSLACNAFTGATEPALDLPPPPTTVTDAPLPTAVNGQDSGLAPTATLTSETVNDGPAVGSPATVTMLVDLNVRSGPGVQYDRVAFLLRDESATILGKDPVSGWWKIQCPARADAPECWVSGGAQYTSGENTEGVPIAAVPPTPTPIPTATPEVAENRFVRGAVLVYGGNRGLWAMPLDTSQDPPAAGEADLLVASADEITPYISPDGRRVAYLVSQLGASKSLRVVNMDGSNDRLLVNSADLPLLVDGGSSALAVHIGTIQWLADSQRIAFNSYVRNLEGPGASSQEDLWTVSLDGTATQQFAAGDGGGQFAISSNNQLILSQQRAVIRADLDGSDQDTMIHFDLVNTASEYVHYPLAQWRADGRAAYVAVPSQQQFTAEATIDLWQIGQSGTATLMQTLPGMALFSPVRWSANGDWLAYIYQLPGLSPVLILADGSGQDLRDYAAGEQLVFHQWSPDSRHFLYSDNGYYAIGELAAAATEILVPDTVADARWLTAATFVVATGRGNNTWHLSSGGLSGKTTILVTVNAAHLQFDVWAPR